MRVTSSMQSKYTMIHQKFSAKTNTSSLISKYLQDRQSNRTKQSGESSKSEQTSNSGNYSKDDVKNNNLGADKPKTREEIHAQRLKEAYENVKKKQEAQANKTNYRFALAKSRYW